MTADAQDALVARTQVTPYPEFPLRLKVVTSAPNRYGQEIETAGKTGSYRILA